MKSGLGLFSPTTLSNMNIGDYANIETDILGRNARMVVRALKGLGKDYATKEIVANMASRYSDEEWRQICEASKRVSCWIRDLVNAEKERRKA